METVMEKVRHDREGSGDLRVDKWRLGLFFTVIDDRTRVGAASSDVNSCHPEQELFDRWC